MTLVGVSAANEDAMDIAQFGEAADGFLDVAESFPRFPCAHGEDDFAFRGNPHGLPEVLVEIGKEFFPGVPIVDGLHGHGGVPKQIQEVPEVASNLMRYGHESDHGPNPVEETAIVVKIQ